MAETRDRATQAIRVALRKAPAFFAILLAVTASLLVWHRYGMERVYEISATSGHRYTASSDAETNGASSATVQPEGKALHLRCQLVQQVQWPYCKIMFNLATDIHGVDLSRYEYLTTDATVRGTGKRGLRLSLVNFEHGFSDPAIWLSNKVNEVDAFDMPPEGRITIPLDLLHTAVWWKDQAKPPLARTNVRIDNNTHLIVETGPDGPLGAQDITLGAIQFHGKAISRAELLGTLVALWIVCAIGWPLAMYVLIKCELRQSKAEAQELAGQAHIDSLTGVLNRQGLRAHLITSSALAAEPMSVIFVDIDQFKRINDGHGHKVGDLVLQQFAATITTLIRSNDKLVRWGGEEFLLLCPMTDAVQASALAEKLRLALESGTWPNGLQVTASFGVARRQNGEDIGQAIERADAQLYAAKGAGRNRVHTHPDEAAA